MKPSRLLEVGFGEGCLLDWAKARGYDVSGNELLPSMVEAAREGASMYAWARLRPATSPSAPSTGSSPWTCLST